MRAGADIAGALAETIARYARDRDMTRRHGAAARQLAEQRFGPHVMVGSYCDLHEHSLGEAHRSARLRDSDRKADARCAG